MERCKALAAWGDSFSSPVTRHFVANDGNGNVTALVNAANGSQSARYEYGPFAEPIRMTGPMAKVNPIRFSTQYADDVTGDLKYLFRDYSASEGRWLTKDPLGERGFETRRPSNPNLLGDGPSVYAFTRNDSISRIDRLGLWIVCCRPGNPDPTDSSIDRAVLPFLVHCEYQESSCPNDGFKWESYPAERSTTGTMKGGKCCSSVTDAEIRTCLKKHPNNGGDGKAGSNCQTAVIRAFAHCCLKSTWVPHWYAGDTKGECVEWGTTTIMEEVGDGRYRPKEVRYCKRYATFPIYEQCTKN